MRNHRRVLRRALVLTSFVVLGGVSTAQASGLRIVPELFSQQGLPLVLANFEQQSPRPTVSWRVCSPECGEVVATGPVLEAGDVPAGSTFEASYDDGGTRTSARSRPWTGQVTNTVAPSLAGEPRIGERVTPSPGAWTGGWGDDRSALGVRACSTPEAIDCRSITGGLYAANENVPSFVIDPAYAGWYVGAVELRVAAQSPQPALAPPPTGLSAFPSPSPSPTVAVGPLIGPIPAPPPVATPPRRTIALRARAVRVGRALRLGTITCSDRCTAQVTLRHGGRTIKRRFTVDRATQRIDLRPGVIPRRATAVGVTVRIDGAPERASRSVALR